MNLQITNDCENQPRITDCGNLPWSTLMSLFYLDLCLTSNFPKWFNKDNFVIYNKRNRTLQIDGVSCIKENVLHLF